MSSFSSFASPQSYEATQLSALSGVPQPAPVQPFAPVVAVQQPLAPFQTQYSAQPSADIVATVNRYNPESPMNEQQVIAANAIMGSVQPMTPASATKKEAGTQSLSLQSRLQQQIAI